MTNAMDETCNTPGCEKCMQYYSRKPQQNRPLAIFMRRIQDNINMYLGKLWCECVEQIQLAQERIQLLSFFLTR
jgi:hypothetical protein